MDFSLLTDFLDGYLPLLGVPGSDTIVYKNGKEVYRHTAGFDDIRFHTPVRENALYNVYSCSKIATAVAAMQLVERGELLFDDPLYVYFPQFRNMTVKGEGGELTPAKNPILIRHLLNMTAGFNYDVQTPAFARMKEATQGRFPTSAIADVLASEPLDFEPGSRFAYSLGFDLLGALIEEVSGVPFGKYLNDNVFAPLGMFDTSVGCPKEKLDRMAKQYEYDRENDCPREIPAAYNSLVFGSDYESGGAGVVTSVNDYIKLAEALTHMGKGNNGERILSPNTVDLMRTPALSGRALDDFRGTPWTRGFNYACGVRVAEDSLAGGFLCNKGTFGWDGRRLSVCSSDPAGQISIFHAEHMGEMHTVVIPRLRNVIYTCLGRD